MAFDLLAIEGEDLRGAPFVERGSRLEALLAGLPAPWNLTPSTTDPESAARWFDEFEAAGCDGIVAKRLDGPYVEGKRDMLKIKHRRSVDCVVGGYRVHKDGDKIGSILLGLYQGGELAFLGHCSGFSDHDRTEMLQTVSRRSGRTTRSATACAGRAPRADGPMGRTCPGCRSCRGWWSRCPTTN